MSEHKALELELLRQLVAEAYPLMQRFSEKHRAKARATRHHDHWYSYHQRRENALNAWLHRANSYRPAALSPREPDKSFINCEHGIPRRFCTADHTATAPASRE